MLSFTMRTNQGSTTVQANDPDKGFHRTATFSTTSDAFQALKEWEKEAEANQKNHETQPA